MDEINSNDKPSVVSVSFPGDLSYIPAIRKFVAEMLEVCSFGPKFAYRSEILVDEVCNNAVSFGCRRACATVDLQFSIFHDRMELLVKDQGGAGEDIKRLKAAVERRDKRTASEITDIPEVKRTGAGLGFEIVRMLSEKVELVIDENNVTSIHVVRKREGVGPCS
jgi:anti-sigma regulatory factor (Ser/Thr protein kinase)